MAVEARRGCGYRKVGGLYLVGSGLGHGCDRLPIPLEICQCCGQGIKQTRGWTWVDIAGIVGGDHFDVQCKHCTTSKILHDGPGSRKVGLYCPDTDTFYEPKGCGCGQGCPLCHNVKAMGKGGLLWIGTQFYSTIEEFEYEAKQQGISRRIMTVPRGFELGKTWLLLAHPRGVIKPTGDLTAKYVPAIFRVWKPERIERIFTESQRDSEEVKKDIERGITPVFVPDNDKDHQGSVYDKDEDSVQESNAPVTPPLFQGGN
jgi:hypothetical protein